MTISRSDELLEKIGQAMLRAVPGGGWKVVVLAVTGAGQLTGTTLVVVRDDGTEDGFVEVDDDGEDACGELRDAMYVEGKGTWYNATMVVSPDSRIDVEFDYDDPPFGGNADRALLIDDQARYRRAAENLPSWHPSRGADES